MQKKNTMNDNSRPSPNTAASITAMRSIDQALCSARLELQRMEDEGGNALNDQQAALVEKYSIASKRIKKAVILQEIYYRKESQE